MKPEIETKLMTKAPTAFSMKKQWKYAMALLVLWGLIYLAVQVGLIKS
jgi:hypothetical protein